MFGKKEPVKQENFDHEPAKLEPVARPTRHLDPVEPTHLGTPPSNGPMLSVPPAKPHSVAREHHHHPLAAASGVAQNAPAAGRASVAFLDQGAKIKGNLQFDCPIQIDGQIEGEIVGKADIVISENARVVATIRAASVIIDGTVNGDVFASDRIELRPHAKVLGNLTAPTLVIQEGAHYEGRCSMNLQPEVRPAANALGERGANSLAHSLLPMSAPPASAPVEFTAVAEASKKGDPWK